MGSIFENLMGGSKGAGRDFFGRGGRASSRRRRQSSSNFMGEGGIDYSVAGSDMEYRRHTPVKLKGVAGRHNGMEGKILSGGKGRYRVQLENNVVVEVAGRNL